MLHHPSGLRFLLNNCCCQRQQRHPPPPRWACRLRGGSAWRSAGTPRAPRLRQERGAPARCPAASTSRRAGRRRRQRRWWNPRMRCRAAGMSRWILSLAELRPPRAGARPRVTPWAKCQNKNATQTQLKVRIARAEWLPRPPGARVREGCARRGAPARLMPSDSRKCEILEAKIPPFRDFPSPPNFHYFFFGFFVIFCERGAAGHDVQLPGGAVVPCAWLGYHQYHLLIGHGHFANAAQISFAKPKMLLNQSCGCNITHQGFLMGESFS